jgi:hypothetical protein
MHGRQLVVALLMGLALGAAVTLVLMGPGVFRARPMSDAALATASQAAKLATPTARVASDTAVAGATRTRSATSTRTATSSPTVTSIPPTATATLVPLATGAARGKDLQDAVLLYDSAHSVNSDVNFCALVQYYGLECKKIALDKGDLTEQALKDVDGKYLKLIGIAGDTLLSKSPLLSADELRLVRGALQTSGVHLLVSGVHADLDPSPLAQLTQAAILGVSQPKDSRRDWTISSEQAEITREFTGQTITSGTAASQGDFALLIDQPTSVATLISSQDDAGKSYAIFAHWKGDGGSVFVDAAAQPESLASVTLSDLYYDSYRFSGIVPLMMTLRYAFGDEVWHQTRNFANLTIDDPALTEPWESVSYKALLKELTAHNYHVTIAMPPASWDKTEPAVAALFRANPDRLSIVQHGNNADGYEFYKYAVAADDEYNGQKLPARPLADQEADIVEGLARMAKHRAQTGVMDDRIMIFPWNIAPEQTLMLLKKYNYLATVNAWDVPLDASHPASWDHGMYQTSMDYSSFAAFSRRCFSKLEEFKPQLQYYLFDLFIDRPTLFCTHAYEGNDLARYGMGAFNATADQISAVQGGVEWRSLGDIVRHLYLQKVGDDGTIDISFYSNQVSITNESADLQTYHVTKVETGNVRIASLTVNGYSFPYKVEDGLLVLDVKVPAHTSFEVRIVYGS